MAAPRPPSVPIFSAPSGIASPSSVFDFVVDPDVLPLSPAQVQKASQMVIVRQNSSTQETISNNGIQKKVHIVVKNQPFFIQAGLLSSVVVDGQNVDFSKFPVETRLLYDSEPLKEVDFVKLKPMDCKLHLNDKGDQVTSEIRIKVLTSQLEDMLFRVRIAATHPQTKKRIDHLTVVSEPIRVVSKPEQVKRKIQQQQNPGVVPVKKAPQPQQPKRDHDEILSAALARIEATCQSQQQLMAQICNNTETTQSTVMELLSLQQFAFTNAVSSASGTTKEKEKENEKKRKQMEKSESPFEIAFKKFMGAYNGIETEDRPGKVRRAINQTSARDTESLSELLNSIQTEASTRGRRQDGQAPGGTLPMSGDTICRCADCPHLAELTRINQFYDDFLGSPMTL
eukprot:TRINITY_DN5662_c0_g1_i1.p1 TRINITY_DN5662_c0_g1~~TRINITY_DN5662_c0_g1_i1.p1  ORF type:complete len:398 (+),score=101.61 TRINITY_DN5662_c0_g1_i1:86-1279(+)